MSWELKVVKDVPTVMDEAGMYTTIHRRCYTLCMQHKVDIRVDVMNASDEPVISFVGSGGDVRRALLQWFSESGNWVSMDHAGYIGYEIHRAMVDADYVQA